ncbi:MULTISPECIES: DNA-processing protein DprA [Acinetobacter]|uniref:DNA-processing protein DprA n=1 Tax=Acinetobacter TaxID=469 RepID=UPI0007389C4E|nr:MULTISPECIES: DNA-processing protein DprA [Acinetobacter]AXF43921.1 DNA-protecting protein DprA [Acinetobacter johnsonii]KUG40286.1 DNA-binding protein [Acinetobacter johnsonii]MDH1278480.1 DNA-processing protein DprA [Acinetobacter johnsonii]MDQ8975449.1 DNA-processing protein DprA [Acinetobacter johnsonii]QBK68198.1 DNA-protecting protein DprA [Acinetobacter johnsonii]
MLNSLSHEQIATITLWYLVQHSLSSFQKLQQHFGTSTKAVAASNLQIWPNLGLHKSHLQRVTEIQTPAGQIKLQTLLHDVQANCDFILLDTESHYPSQLLPYSDRPPILFGQGNPQSLLQPQVAIVGSRKPSPHGKQVAYDFAYYLAEKGFYICSGLAEGIDAAAHQGGLKYQRTIAVMGTGLDLTYPFQHQTLRTQILENNGCIITEFLPHTPPLQHNFPRRNRIVSALSLGVVVAEAALKSGSLGTAKSAAEQGKTIFAIPGHIYSEHHQGCHQLIREGAILVDHPEQIIEDLALPTQWHSQSQSQETTPSASIEIPSNLLELYNQLDWVGQNMDQLNFKLNTDIATLTSQLMELEILGLAQQQAGNYLRCRSSQ